MRAGERVCPFRHDLAHDGRRSLPHRLEGDDPVARRAIVGDEVECAALGAGEAPVLAALRHDGDEPGGLGGGVHHAHFIAVIRAGAGADDQPAAILAGRALVIVPRVVGGGEDERIGALRRADAVEIDAVVEHLGDKALALRGCRVARIEKAAVVGIPGDARELHPIELIGHNLAGIDIEELDDPPIAAAILHGIGDALAITARGPFGQRGGAVLGPEIGVDQRARLGIALAHHQHELVLQAGVAPVEAAAAALDRQGDALIIVEFGEPGLQGIAAGQGGEIGIRHLVLRRHPVRHVALGADIAFQPAIGVCHAHAMEHVRHVRGLAHGIGDAAGGQGGGGFRGRRHRAAGENEGHGSERKHTHNKAPGQIFMMPEGMAPGGGACQALRHFRPSGALAYKDIFMLAPNARPAYVAGLLVHTGILRHGQPAQLCSHRLRHCRYRPG